MKATAASQIEAVKEYYARTLKTNKDLKTTACCSTDAMPSYIKPLAAKIHPEVSEKFYGCGVPVPQALGGQTVLDLGCGTGRDLFVLSALVGEAGSVIGVDMTAEQLAVAEKHLAYHVEAFGHARTNVTLKQGYIEDLHTADIEDASVDVVVSNCVFNLSPDKGRLYQEVFRVLKPGGELYFSDVFVDRRLPTAASHDQVLLGECLGGAQYMEDFRRSLLAVGCRDYRVVGETPIAITNDEVAQKVGNASFSSVTLRAFKLDLEDRCEDYGQVAYYKGTIDEAPHAFRLDDHHIFETGRPVTVCSNTAAMLMATRFGEHFRVEGDTSTHFGLFDCGPESPSSRNHVSSPCC